MQDRTIKIKLTKKQITTIGLFAAVIFLFGGGPDIIFTLITGGDNNLVVMNHAKVTGLSPASMFCYILGLTGLMMLYWGGKDFHKNEELAKKRLLAAIVLIGACVFGLELLLRFGYGAI